MRLLYLTSDPGVPVLGQKGASVHVRAMVSALAAAGANVVVASPRVSFEGEQLDANATLVEIEPVLPKTIGDEALLRDAVARQAERIVEVATAFRVDAIYERLALFSIGGVQAARALGIPHVLEVNAPLRTEAARFRTLPHAGLAAELEEVALDGTDRVFAVSTTLAALLVADGLDADKVEVAANGIDAEALGALAPERGAGFVVGFAGSLKPWHGIDVLLEGFAAALRHEPALRLEIVGDGPLADALAGCGLPSGSLAYLGQLTHRETMQTVSRWDVGAAPYPPLDDFYFSPLKVGEYMACGACAVASDVPVLRELLGGGTRGVLVEPGNAAAFADALVVLARDRRRARALGERARAFALHWLGWDRNAERAFEALAPVGARP
jgi:glycosyltransferase involved in cell wall biosynthesis